jgi:O-antigen/teichoic acid export membrane protein
LTAAAAAPAAVLRGRHRTRLFESAGGGPLLTLATVASGVLTYAFLILAARALGREQYGAIGVLWAAMFVTAIVAFRPLEQTASQGIARRLAAGGDARSVVRTMAALAVAVAVVLGIGFAAAWHPLADRLFGSDPVLMAGLVAGVFAYGASYLVRGVLGGVRWFGGYAIVLLSDGAIRLAVAIPLIVFASRTIATAAVVAAGVGGAVVPLLVGRRRLRRELRGREEASSTSFPLRRAASFAAPATLIAAADQILVNGGPLLVAAGGAPRATVGVVFAATMLVRAPVYVFQGFAASLLPNLTHLAREHGRRRLRVAILRTASILFLVGTALTAAAGIAGPATMRIVYGSTFAAPAAALVLLAAGVACYLAAGAFSQALLALEHAVAAAACWSAAVLSFGASYFLLPGTPLLRSSAALAIASLIAALGLGATLLRRAK